MVVLNHCSKILGKDLLGSDGLMPGVMFLGFVYCFATLWQCLLFYV